MRDLSRTVGHSDGAMVSSVLVHQPRRDNLATRAKATGAKRNTSRRRRRTIFFPPRNKKLADIISIESAAVFKESIRRLQRGGLTATEKRALVLAQNRAKAMLKKRSLSANERRQLESIARIPLPPVTRTAA
jgi:hypothetical protein